MWILSITPDWFLHLLLVVSFFATLVGFLLAGIPLIARYAMMLRVLGTAILALSLYLEGGLADNKIWEARVKEVEAKLAKAEAQSARANTKLTEKVASKQAKVKEKTIIVKQYIDREVVKYDNQCKIPQAFTKAHNDAAEGPQK